MSLRLRVEQFPEGFQKKVHLEKINESNLSALSPSEQAYILEEKQRNKIPSWDDTSEAWEDYYWDKRIKEKTQNQQEDLERNLRFLHIRKFFRKLKESIKGACSRRSEPNIQPDSPQNVEEEDESWSHGPVKWFSTITPLDQELPNAPPQLNIKLSPNLPAPSNIVQPSRPIKFTFNSAVPPSATERYERRPHFKDIKLKEAVDSKPHAPVIPCSKAPKIPLILYPSDLQPVAPSTPDESARAVLESHKPLFSAKDALHPPKGQVRAQKIAKNLVYEPNINPLAHDVRDIAPQALTMDPFVASGNPKTEKQGESETNDVIARVFNVPKPSAEILINQRVNQEICLGGEMIQVETRKKELKSQGNQK